MYKGFSAAADKKQVLVSVKELKKYFNVKKGFLTRHSVCLKAVDGISFDLQQGETLGLVGESGCGKTTTGLTILRLIEPTGGKVFFAGQDILQLPAKSLRLIRREMQVIFQDPYSSLNPSMTAEQILSEPLKYHGVVEKKNISRRIRELLGFVGLSAGYLDRYPHEFSGGQRQRIVVARALSLNPRFIVCDEATSALDVSVKAQVINLLADLQAQLGLTYLFISHDMRLVRQISDRTAIMYLGKLVEMGPTEQIFVNPLHPYTIALLSAIPQPDPGAGKQRIILPGDVPSPVNIPTGCRFHTRCYLKKEICTRVEPDLAENSDSHFVSCHLSNGRRGGVTGA